MAAETAESGGPAADTPSTDPSTNWIVAGGSLRDSIAFDTSSSFDADAAGEVSSAKGATFLREPASGCGPCEVNICFRQKHDIHRIYVRSTAHVYEIYHALEQPCQSNEYVCTVRCGEASTKVLLPEINEQTLPMEHHCKKQASSNMPATSAKSSCTNVSNEDGWVDVNAPDSPVLLGKNEILKSNSDVKFSPKAQTCYEATAEISDLSPCISITLRLLSLQPKGQVYIEEIYIYADPVGAEASGSNQGTSSGNMSGTSLLSMLVPGLLQFSKSGNSRRKDKGISDTCDTIAAEETENGKFGMAREILRETYFSEKILIDVREEVPVQISPQNANLGSCQEVPAAHTDTPCYDAGNVGYSRIEKILEELLSRVGRIEIFCASIENKMTKPLVAIETKLQKLEQQLDLLTERTNCSKPPRSPRIFVPEFACVGSDSENKDHVASVNPEQSSASNMSISEHSDAHKIFPALLVRAPDFELDETPCSSSNTNSSLARENLSKEKRSLHDTPACNQDSKSNVFFDEILDMDRERNSNGKSLKFSAPEFFSEDYSPSGDDASAPPEKNQSNDRSAFSIDTALASALEALLSSTTKSPACNQPFDAQEQIEDCKDGDPVIEVASEEAVVPKDSEHLDVFCNEKERKNDISTLIYDRLFPLKGTNVQDDNSGIASKIISEIDEIQQPPSTTTIENHKKDAPSATFEDWNTSSMAIDAQNGDQFPLHTVVETHEDTTNTSDICGMANSPTCLDRGETFTGSDVDDADKHQNKKQWFGESGTESIMDGLNVDSGHAGWSDLSSTDSVEVKFPLPSWLTGRGSDCESETDNIGGVTAVSSNAGSDMSSPMLMNPEVGTEHEKTFNSLLDSPQIILESENSHDANQTSASVLEDLLCNFSNVEEKLCESKDNADKSDGGLLSSSQYCANASKSSMVDNEPLIDIEEESRAKGFGSSIDVNQPLVNVEEIVFATRSSSIEAEEHSHTIPPDLQLPFSSLI